MLKKYILCIFGIHRYRSLRLQGKFRMTKCSICGKKNITEVKK